MAISSLSLEYRNAKKNYKAIAKSSNIMIGVDDDKENSGTAANTTTTHEQSSKKKSTTATTTTQKQSSKEKSSSSSNHLRPSFDPKQQQDKSDADTTSKSNKPIIIKPRLPLNTEYNTTKLMFRASKSRQKTTTSNTHKKTTSSTNKNVKNTTKIETESKPTRNSPVDKRQETHTNSNTTHTATTESGLKALNLIRPIDNKTFEFGLAAGIQVHLIESVKLCGLKRGRETSIINMITTLCNHLTNREAEINNWIEFADKVALSAAVKLEESMQEYQVVCVSRDESRKETKDARLALCMIQQEVQTVKDEVNKVKQQVVELLSTFPSMLCDFEQQLRRQITFHNDTVRSECKSEIGDAIDELNAAHDIEKQRSEEVIGRLEMSVQAEVDKRISLQAQLDSASGDLKKEQSNHISVQADLKSEVDRSHKQLQEANDKIQSLEEQIQQERIQQTKEIEEMEEQVKAELDDIDKRVKASFKKLSDTKNKEIENALARAQVAEASSKAAQKMLRELRARVLVQPIATAQMSSEN